MKILLIDENVVDNYINQKMFSNVGINNVITFEKHIDVIRYLLNEKEIPDYVFIGLDLPHRDGFDLLRKIKKLDIAFDKIKFALISNSLNPSDKLKARDLSIDFIEKPLTPETIKKHLILN